MSVALVRVAGPGEDDKILNQNDVKIPLTLPAILGRGSLLKVIFSCILGPGFMLTFLR